MGALGAWMRLGVGVDVAEVKPQALFGKVNLVAAGRGARKTTPAKGPRDAV